MGNKHSSAKKKIVPRNMKKWKLDYTDDVSIEADMHVPFYLPLDEANQPTFEEDNGAVWIQKDESADHNRYLEPRCFNLAPNTVTMVTVLDGYGWDIIPDASAETIYEEVADESNCSPEDVIALQRFQTKLTVFRKVIVASIDIYKILPHLSFVEYPHEFKRIAKRNNSAAVELLVETLLETNIYNHWIMFIVGLQRCGYEHFAKLLVDKDDINRRYPRKYMLIMAAVIKPLILPSKVTCYLWNRGVLNDSDVNLIDHAEVSEGVGNAVDILLDRIQHRHAHWYSHFVDALMYANLADAAALLDIPELHIASPAPPAQPPPYPPRSASRQAVSRPLSRPFTKQNSDTMASPCVKPVPKEREYMYDMETNTTDSETYTANPEELCGDTALPQVEIVEQKHENTMPNIVYLPEGHTMPLRFKLDTATYSNESTGSDFAVVNWRDSSIIDMDNQSSEGFVQIGGTRSNLIPDATSQPSTGKMLSKSTYPTQTIAFIKPPALPPRTNPIDGKILSKSPYPTQTIAFIKPPALPPRTNPIDDTTFVKQLHNTRAEYSENSNTEEENEERQIELDASEEHCYEWKPEVSEERPPPPLQLSDKVNELKELEVTASRTPNKYEDNYKQADRTHTLKKNDQVDEVNYKPDGHDHDGRPSNVLVDEILMENDIEHANTVVEMVKTAPIPEQPAGMTVLDIASINTFSREMLIERIELLKHEQNDDREKIELLNKLAEEINNLSFCKESKIGALNNLKQAGQNLKTQQSKLARIATQNENSDTNDEYPSEGIYSARQLEAERQDAANSLRNLLIAVCLNNIQTNEFTSRSQIPLSHNSFKNGSFQRLHKSRRSSRRDSAFYSGSNIDTLYSIPEQD